jgi:UBA/TS-N domain
MEKDQTAPAQQAPVEETPQVQPKKEDLSTKVESQESAPVPAKDLPKCLDGPDSMMEQTKPVVASKGNPELVSQLVEMGFSEALALKAVEQTSSLEEAANLILIMEENEDGKMAAPTKDQVKQLHYKMVV